jgi:hypothetical protein
MNRRVFRPAVLLAAFAALIGLAATQARADISGAFPHLEAWPTTLSLGGIPAALGYGVEAVLENPTGMLRGDGSGIAFSHASLFTGGLVRHQAAAFCWLRHEELPEWKGGQVRRRQGETRSAWGIGVTNLSGDLPGSDTYGELEIALSYARLVPLGLQSGFRLRMLQARSTVDGSSGGGLAVDVGLEGSIGGWRAGAVARALASSVKWDRSQDGPLPRGFDLGLERGLGGGLRVMAGGALLPTGSPRRLAVAAAWRLPGTPLSLRAGPAWRNLGDERMMEFSAGMGARIGAFSADYGMRTGPPGLGEIHRFSLRVTFS